MKTVLLATGNKHKVEEIKSILAPYQLDIISFADLDKQPEEVIEDKDTFIGNASKKALQVAQETGYVCLADDSGLEVFSLNSEPGVYSARYAGENATDQENYEKLLKAMTNLEDRSARFCCCIAVASPNGILATAEGEVRGVITLAPQGVDGFGYDPCFMPDGFDKTFAELGSEVKDSISHRGNALANLLATHSEIFA